MKYKDNIFLFVLRAILQSFLNPPSFIARKIKIIRLRGCAIDNRYQLMANNPEL